MLLIIVAIAISVVVELFTARLRVKVFGSNIRVESVGLYLWIIVVGSLWIVIVGNGRVAA